jgi:hypothetical protein
VSEGGYNLGNWVSTQRRGKENLSSDRIQRLDAIGFVWDPLQEQWEEGFGYLLKFKEREGHCRVPARASEDGYPLGTWVSKQRTTKEELSSDRVKRLDEIGFVWDVLHEQWEERFGYLLRFKEREGHCRVPQRLIENHFKLGNWVGKQREGKENLSRDRVKRLDEIGFVWDLHHEQWEEGFGYLLRFKEREGHCRVPATAPEGGYKLGLWVRKQRTTKEELSSDRVKRLDDIGFVWDVLHEQWEQGFGYLLQFKEREGHCKVPLSASDAGYPLGTWVSTQRNKKENLSSDRVKRLDEIGFVWEPHHEQWEEGFGYLLRFKEREGHCRVPATAPEGGYNLGLWVRKQRNKKENLSSDRVKRLDEIGFVWDPFHEQWEQGFGYLLRFKEREGHCKVPQAVSEGGYPLGSWVSTQRNKKENLSSDRIQRLDAIGFVWKVIKAEQ